MIYLVTYSNGRPPTAERSLRQARCACNSRYFTRSLDGDLLGYGSRAEMYADREGCYAAEVIRPIRDPAAFALDEDESREWREAVRQIDANSK